MPPKKPSQNTVDPGVAGPSRPNTRSRDKVKQGKQGEQNGESSQLDTSITSIKASVPTLKALTHQLGLASLDGLYYTLAHPSTVACWLEYTTDAAAIFSKKQKTQANEEERIIAAAMKAIDWNDSDYVSRYPLNKKEGWGKEEHAIRYVVHFVLNCKMKLCLWEYKKDKDLKEMCRGAYMTFVLLNKVCRSAKDTKMKTHIKEATEDLEKKYKEEGEVVPHKALWEIAAEKKVKLWLEKVSVPVAGAPGELKKHEIVGTSESGYAESATWVEEDYDDEEEGGEEGDYDEEEEGDEDEEEENAENEEEYE